MLVELLDQVKVLIKENLDDLGVETFKETIQDSQSWKASDYSLIAIENGEGETVIRNKLAASDDLDTIYSFMNKSNSVMIFVFVKKDKNETWDGIRKKASLIAEDVLNLIAKNITLDLKKRMSVKYQAGDDKVNNIESYVYKLTITIDQER